MDGAVTVTAALAARLAGVSERTIRTWLTSTPPRLAGEKRRHVGRPAAWAIDVNELARLPGVSDRTIRAWLTSTTPQPATETPAMANVNAHPAAWAIDVDDLAALPGVTLDVEMLARLAARTPASAASLSARLAALERELHALRTRVRILELGREPPATATATTATATTPDVPAPPREVYAGMQSRTFRTRADAARWLARHGVNERTPKTWKDWHAVALEPGAILDDAMRRCDTSNWRIPWRLHRCSDPSCVCHEHLPLG